MKWCRMFAVPIRTNKARAAVFSPIAVICVGFISASAFSVIMQEWAFIPLALVYWGVTFAVAYRFLGMSLITALFRKPDKSVLWAVSSLAVGMIPLPILLLNLNLLTSPAVIALWLTFAAVNPLFEELYWRGFLLSALPFPKWLSVGYSTLLFAASHPLLWGVFSIANRSPIMWASLMIMGAVWSVACLKTSSLRWCVISHFLADIFNLSVFVFLNLYVPPVM